MPEPSIDDLLTSFTALKGNKHHIVTASLDTAMRQMNRAYSSCNVWKTTTILSFDKEVIRKFVDENGVETNQVYSDLDSCKRRRILFFLRTLESLDAGPQPADYNVAADEGGKGDVEMEELKAQNEKLQKQMQEWQQKQEEMMLRMMQGIEFAAKQSQALPDGTSSMGVDHSL